MARQQNEAYESEEQKMLRFAKEDFSQFDNTLNPNRDENVFINSLKIFIEKNRKDISTSQLRNIFSKFKKIDNKNFKATYNLRPQLAYVYGRTDSNKKGMKKLLVSLDYFIQKIDNENKCKMFKDFFEAVIAYHKFYGGGN